MADASSLLKKKLQENFQKNFGSISTWGKPTGEGYTFSPEVESAIKQAAVDNDVPLDYMRAMAFIESTGNPNARHQDGRAVGLYQFVPDTAKQYGLIKDGKDLRTDPVASAQAGAQYMKDNLDYLIKRSQEPSFVNAYLAHQQGPFGSTQILNNNITPSIRAAMDRNLGKGLDAPQFVDLWGDRTAKVMNKILPQSYPAPVHQLEPNIPQPVNPEQAAARQAFKDNLGLAKEYITDPVNNIISALKNWRM